MEFSEAELNLIRQWFNAVDDLAPEYLEQADRDLGKRITEHVFSHQQNRNIDAKG
jgi:hypothetical protein